MPVIHFLKMMVTLLSPGDKATGLDSLSQGEEADLQFFSSQAHESLFDVVGTAEKGSRANSIS